MEINKLISKKQQDEIVNLIKKQCHRYKEISNLARDIFYEPYTKMRKKHDLTAAVISGFAPGKLNISGLEVTDLKYGLGDKLEQPEIISQNGIFHIYSDGSKLKGNKISERSKEFNSNLDSLPLFFMIVFSADKNGNLKKVDIKIPNERGVVIETHNIYKRPSLAILSA